MRHLRKSAVLLEGEKSAMFSEEQGVVQGCSLSPIFNVQWRVTVSHQVCPSVRPSVCLFKVVASSTATTCIRTRNNEFSKNYELKSLPTTGEV